MMMHSDLDRLNLRADLMAIRGMSDRVIVLLPTVANDSSHDYDTGAGRDISEGDGTGLTFTWLKLEISAMVREVDINLITFGSVPPGVEIGDLLITVGVRDGETFESAKANEYAYVYARGKRYRVWGVNALGVTKPEQWIAFLRATGQTTARHPDY